MSSVVQITDSEFETEVKQASQTVLVYFWAPWCGPCRLMSPIMDTLAGTYENLKIVKLEVDANPQSVSDCKVEGVPAIRLFQNGEQVEASEGAMSKQRLTDLLDARLPAA